MSLPPRRIFPCKKLKISIHSFQRYTKESCNLIGQQHFGLQLDKQIFPRYEVCIEKQRIIRYLISR